MSLVYNEDERMLQDAARSFLGERAPVAALRKLRDTRDPDGFSRELWASMVEMLVIVCARAFSRRSSGNAMSKLISTTRWDTGASAPTGAPGTPAAPPPQAGRSGGKTVHANCPKRTASC